MKKSSKVIAALVAGTLLGTYLILLGDEEERAIREEMRDRSANEIWGEEFAETYGDDGIPVMIDILESGNSNKYALGKVCFYLGKMGATEAFDPIVDFINAPLPEVLEQKHSQDIMQAMWGLAFLGTDDALAFLKELTTDEYWEQRQTHPTTPYLKLDEAGARYRLRELAVIAIGRCDNEEAKNILENLRTTLGSEFWAQIDGALYEVGRRRTGAHLLDRKKFVPLSS